LRSRWRSFLPPRFRPARGAASIAAQNFGDLVLDALTSPLGMGLQVLMLTALGALVGGFRPASAPRKAVEFCGWSEAPALLDWPG
jgi:hypothetical protein